MRWIKKIVQLLIFILIIGGWSKPIAKMDGDIKSFLQSYPEDISIDHFDVLYNDWVLSVNGEKLYWAQSRFLPESELSHKEKWRPYIDYEYDGKLKDPDDEAFFTPEVIQQLKSDEFFELRKNNKPYYSRLYELLWNGSSRAETEKNIVHISFLGHGVNIHKKLIPALECIEVEIYELRDEEILKDAGAKFGGVRFFLSQLEEIQGYAWRDVSDTSNRSNHSWGIAIDVLPKKWKRKNMYWRWRADWDKDWMLLSLDKRWMPSPAVIKVFEKEGFIWGGNWLLWDNMHFEYRPELLQ